MSARGWSLCVGACLISFLIGASQADEPSLVGDLIYPKSSDVPIRVGDRVIGTASDLDCSARVRQVDGDLLCIWVDGKKTEGWIKRSDVCLAQEAIDYFTEQIAAHPNDDKAYLSRAAAREELDELDNALEDATQAIRLNPTPRAFKSRGSTWLEKKECDKALADYDEAIRLDPYDAQAFLKRAQAWLFKKQFDKMAADLDEAMRLEYEANNSDFVWATFQVAFCALTSDPDGQRVAATVNGVPIFEGEILERYADNLATIRKSSSREQYRQMCDQLIQRDLPAHVERRLLSEAMLATLKTKSLKYQEQFDDFMQRTWAEQLEKMQADFKVASTAELDQELHRHGTSIAMMEYQYRNKTLAQQHIATSLKKRHFNRDELLAYYEQHAKVYEIKPRVKWQQILISRRDEEKAEAQRKILLDGLKAGRDFGELAVELSDGPTAENKGLFDWTNQGSLVDESLDEVLFKLPIGETSELLTSPQRYQVVRVLERESETRHMPFDDVEVQIRAKLTETDQQDKIATLIGDLWRAATIKSPFTIQAVANIEEAKRINPKLSEPLSTSTSTGVK